MSLLLLLLVISDRCEFGGGGAPVGPLLVFVLPHNLEYALSDESPFLESRSPFIPFEQFHRKSPQIDPCTQAPLLAIVLSKHLPHQDRPFSTHLKFG